jgi:hypothetical protein
MSGILYNSSAYITGFVLTSVIIRSITSGKVWRERPQRNKSQKLKSGDWACHLTSPHRKTRCFGKQFSQFKIPLLQHFQFILNLSFQGLTSEILLGVVYPSPSWRYYYPNSMNINHMYRQLLYISAKLLNRYCCTPVWKAITLIKRENSTFFFKLRKTRYSEIHHYCTQTIRLLK